MKRKKESSKSSSRKGKGGGKQIYGGTRRKKAQRTGSEWITCVTRLFSQNPNKSLNYRQVAHAVGAETEKEKQLISRILQTLLDHDVLELVDRGKYKLNATHNTVQGIFHKEKGDCFVSLPEDGSEYPLRERRTMDACEGDKVTVRLVPGPHGVIMGEVVSVDERSKEVFVGLFEEKNHYCCVYVNDRVLDGEEIIVPTDQRMDAQDGDKVLIQITQWPSSSSGATAKILDVLGKKGDNTTEMHAILAEYNLPYRYPEACEQAANKLSESISAEEIAKREDFREVTTFTIDPDTAKDFDDALSIRELGNGQVEVGVHIADVTYYVKPNDVIDKEAAERATSVYLVDRTVPMLPEKLCNNLCSLNPQVDRLAFACVFVLNESSAEVLQHRIVKTVIRSDRRFTYAEAQERIDTGEGDLSSEIMRLHTMAQQLRKARFANGSVMFESQELRFVLDENGKPVDVKPREHGTANELIEEFMLLANKYVAEEVGKAKKKRSKKTSENAERQAQLTNAAKPFVYRVHDLPDPEKLRNTTTFLRRSKIMNIQTKEKGKISVPELNRIFAETEHTAFAPIVQMMLVRTMARAYYTTQNIGHYGLGFQYYTHFTSPIRRYPDVMVHRLLEYYLFQEGEKPSVDSLEEQCKHCSEREQLADQAERASVKYKQAEYLSERIGKVFDGVISGVTEWGLYITLNYSGCEGLLPIRKLGDDYYNFDEENYCLVGKRYKQKYQLGQSVTIRVAGIDQDRRLIDFELAE